MSTYLGIPHPSALLLQLRWASLGAKSRHNGKQLVFRESDVFGLFGKVMLGGSQKMLLRLYKMGWDPDGQCCHGPN